MSGENENDIESELRVFPNPTHGEFEISLNVEESSKLNVRLYSLSGQLIFEDSKSDYSGYYGKKIDLNGNPVGIYFLSVKAGDETQVEKVLYNR